jgi:mgtE-like transporter
MAERLAAAPARLARRTRRLLGYWRAERRTLRQGVVALLLSTCAGFVAGLTLASITGTLSQLPGLIVLIPAAVGMKGTIFGAIGARLGTANAAGLLELDLRRGGMLHRNVYVAVVTTFTSSLWLAALAILMSAAFGEATISFWELAVISIVGGALGSALILLVTLALSALSYRRGWDLDAVGTPMVTAIGDMATLPSLFVATFLVRNDVVAGVLAGVFVLAALYATLRAYLNQDPAIRRIVLEMTAVILLTPVLDVLAGALLRAREPQLLATPVVLLLIPPFVSQAGALGGIFSSRITSKLQIGVITPRGLPEVPAVVDASIVTGLSVFVFTLIGGLGWLLGTFVGLENTPGSSVLIGGTLFAGLVLTPITILAGYYLAIGTYRFGLDPDNQSVPIITSAMDLSGVACILFVMTVLGVLG